MTGGMSGLSDPVWRLLPRALRRDGCLSYPKSGRTWLRVMLDDLGCPLTYAHGPGRFKDARDWHDLDARALARFRRVVFLHRDPRDTAVSAWHHATRRMRVYDGPVSDFLRDPRHGVEKIARYNLMFLQAPGPVPRLAVGYESLRADTPGQLARICAFLGRPQPADRLAAVAEAHGFARMQAAERAGAIDPAYAGVLGARRPGDADSLKVRRGRVGGYAEELSPADAAFCDAVLDRLDYAGALARLAPDG